jgi:hypothetical protein
VCTGTTDKVGLINVSLRLLCIKLPFQAGSLSTTLSIRYCQADLGSLDVDRGIPRYLIGNSTTAQGKELVARLTCDSSHRMGAIWHLLKLHRHPDAPSNSSRIPLVRPRLEATGAMNIIRLSAYKDNRCLIYRTPIV